MAGRHVIPSSYLELQPLSAGMKHKMKEKGVKMTRISQIFYYPSPFPDAGSAAEKQIEPTSPSSSQWGSAVLFSPGLSAQLDEQQQGGKSSWQLKWGKKETLNRREASLEPTSNLTHGDTS